MAPQTKVWFITGISRGLGRAIAQAALQHGDAVIGTTRDGKTDLAAAGGRLHVVPLDVTEPEKVRAAAGVAWALHGRLDVIVNNAGFGLLGAVEEVELSEVRRVFETNFFGTLNVTQAVLPRLRAQASGHIFNISSVGGFVGLPGFGLYNSTKFAVEGMSEALYKEVGPLGIRVTIVEPGAFRTDFLAQSSLLRTSHAIDAYAASSGKTRQSAEVRNGQQPGDPVRAAEAIVAAADSPNPPLRLILGIDALTLIRTKLAEVAEDLNAWESVSRSTNHAEAKATGVA